MHTSRWDHSVDLRGKRVGVIGTGASAIQVIPAVAPEVERLTVFQRTPIWCLPKLDAPHERRAARRMLRWVPGADARHALAEPGLRGARRSCSRRTSPASSRASEPAAKAAAHKLLREVEDPAVREKLTPRYNLGCKRPSFHNEYLRTFNRDNVLLETAAIEEITPTAVRTADGVEHPIDVLVLATGFKVFDTGNMPPFVTRGVGGVALEEWWGENRLQAYEGVSVPGFPNWFSILGPYGFNGQSYFGLIETQMRHIVRCLARARERRRQACRDHPRGQPALLGVDARPPPQPDLLPGLLLELQQLLLRSARRRALQTEPQPRGGMAQRPLRPRRLRLRRMSGARREPRPR